MIEGRNIGKEDKLINLLKWLKEQNCEPTFYVQPSSITLEEDYKPWNIYHKNLS